MNEKQARAAIKELHAIHERTPAQILRAIVRNGGEWPTVVGAITEALNLTPEEVEEMESNA